MFEKPRILVVSFPIVDFLALLLFSRYCSFHVATLFFLVTMVLPLPLSCASYRLELQHQLEHEKFFCIFSIFWFFVFIFGCCFVFCCFFFCFVVFFCCCFFCCCYIRIFVTLFHFLFILCFFFSLCNNFLICVFCCFFCKIS